MSDLDVPAVETAIQLRQETPQSDRNPSEASLPQFNLQPHPRKANHSYYGVRIVTGDHEDIDSSSGVHSDSCITLIGNKAKSTVITIHTVKNEDLILECQDNLGEVHGVVLENKSTEIQTTVVQVYDLQEQVLPCSAAEKSVLFSTVRHEVVSGFRTVFRPPKWQKLIYRWKKYKEAQLPSCLSGPPPPEEWFHIPKANQFFSQAILEEFKESFRGVTINLSTLHGYEEYAKLLKVPQKNVHVDDFSRWTSDEEFGRQILNGVNPVVIRKCEQLPMKFPVTEEMVQSSLCRGISLEEEMKDGHVYICDLEIMDNLPCSEGAYCAAPLCLLYVNAVGQLKPIAIQLSQTPGDKSPIFLPTDRWPDWVAAKMYYLSSHAQFHQLSTHYLTCHAAMEVYAMGLMRNIPHHHPLYKLLRPHVHYTISINFLAREALISPKGAISEIFSIGHKGQTELLQRAYKKYSIHWSNIKRNIQERGVDDSGKLPHYYYRDDGMEIWNAFEEFVRSIIDAFYSNDEEVEKDSDLQSFAKDIHHHGFPGHDDVPDGHDFPRSITKKDDLIEICTLIMFTGSAQHAAVNFGQFDYYSFIPNSPVMLHKPPPTEKGVISTKYIMDALPHKRETQLTVGLASLLSTPSPDEIYITNQPAEHFTDMKAKEAAHQLQERLNSISFEIKKRNLKIEVPYVYLLPERVPKSVSI